MIIITESAQEKIKSILEEETDSTLRLRMYVQGGGCAGFSYGFSLDNEVAEDDFEIPAGETTVIVDAMSMQYVENATIY